MARWLFWHQLYCWLSKAEFTLGLALACTHAMGLASHDATVEYLVDLITDVQTVRSCQTAAERDPEFTPEGYCSPNHAPSLRRQHRHAEGAAAHGRDPAHLARLVAGRGADRPRSRRARVGRRAWRNRSPAAATPRRQRAALLQMAWDHVGSALDHRESVYELHANGGIPSWRGRLRRSFNRYEELANGVLQQLDLPMPKIDLQSIRNAPLVVRRPVNPTVPPPSRPAAEPARNPVTAGKVP